MKKVMTYIIGFCLVAIVCIGVIWILGNIQPNEYCMNLYNSTGVLCDEWQTAQGWMIGLFILFWVLVAVLAVLRNE